MRGPAAVVRRPLLVGTRLRTRLTPGPRLRLRFAIAALLALTFAALYMLWLRDSSLVAVEQVEVTGLTSRDAPRVRAAIESTAGSMTTLHLDVERLEQAAAAFPVVASIEVSPDFPNGLNVHVVEHRPAAMLEVGGRSVPVAGDGTVLSGLPVEGELPTIELSGSLPQQLAPGAALDAALVAGAAPAVIRDRIEEVSRSGDGRGVVAQLRDGPELVFGHPVRLTAKWAAAVRVLADEDASGATYIDVRIPERPVAGGLPVETLAPVAPASAPSVDPSLAAPQTGVAVPPSVPETGVVEPAPVAPETYAPAPATPVTSAPTGTGGGATAVPQP